MRYSDSDRQSDQVEDRRGQDTSGLGRRGGIQIPLGGGGMSITTLIVIGVVCLLLGINPLTLLTGGGIEIPNMPRPEQMPRRNSQDVPGLPRQPRVAAQNDEMSKFVRHVLADTEDVWEQVFKNAGRTYEKPRLVIFANATQTKCGVGQAAMGPFYCPLDRTVYIDLSFYDQLKRRFQAPGDFAQAYVIAHEVGHHVQTILGIADKVMAFKQRASSQAQANALQVRMELQADCFAGVWASLNDRVKSRLEPGDIEEGLAAAAAIGDDTLQRQTQGRVVPESFTHGSSAQRVAWFKKGLETGRTQVCDTFNAND
ncbi:MAG: neutral zinc metallopeptidase [Hyphomicrobiaceae bacterium]|nr:neutral zinc metallopeptidase [Hyphomicrobiaceae bacterium]